MVCYIFILILVGVILYLCRDRIEGYLSPSYFADKTVLITGGTSGIGLATAKEFVKEGARRIVVCGRTTEKWETAKASMSSKEKSAIEYYQCDVRVESQVKKMIADIEPIHIAFNNAGVASGTNITKQSLKNKGGDDITYSITNKEGDECAPGTRDPTSKKCENPIFTDGMGLIYCLKYELPSMRKFGIKGAIVNTASVNSLWGAPGSAVYSMAKGMVQMLTKSAGVNEVRNKIPVRINCVAPGPVMTPLLINQFPKGTKLEEVHQQASKGVAMGRVAQPCEIATMVVFLSRNDKASYMTGGTYVVDGGLTASPVF